MGHDDAVLRTMLLDDVAAVLDVQEPAAVAGLSGVFPQDLYPFPRATIADRWRTEIQDPDIDCFVIGRGGTVAGFAAVRGEELLSRAIPAGARSGRSWGGSRRASARPVRSRPTQSC